MSTEDPRGRLERALDLAPEIGEEVDPTGFGWREETAERILAARPLPDIVVSALAGLAGEHQDTFGDIRLVVAALEPAYLEELDMTVLRAVAAERLSEAIGAVAFLLRTSDRVSRALQVFSDEYALLLDVAG